MLLPQCCCDCSYDINCIAEGVSVEPAPLQVDSSSAARAVPEEQCRQYGRVGQELSALQPGGLHQYRLQLLPETADVKAGAQDY